MTFDLLTLKSMSRGATYVANAYLFAKFEVDRIPELRRLQLSIDRQLRSPNFYVLGGKGSQISNFIFLTPRRHFLGGNDV